MTHYGVRRLIAINSGGFIYAELDLSKPVHLMAPNNRGKSTLVNALQFLYIDDIAKMAFGKRSIDDTKRHYFAHDPSYLIFECNTAAGIQCLLVRGLGHLKSFGFERYVFEREYARKDFEDERGRVAGFELIQSRLANRRLLEIPSKLRYWEVLSGLNSSEEKDVPRLTILPLKKADEYRAFREVFVSLLKLSDMDGQHLQRLIIACHARDISEMKIDIAAEYKAEFERAERAEHDAAFIREVRDEIDRGGEFRVERDAILAELKNAAPPKIKEAIGLTSVLVQLQTTRTEAIIAASQERTKEDGEKSRFERDVGTWEERLSNARKAVSALEAEHAKWEKYSPLILQSHRDKVETLANQIAQLRQNLQANVDVSSLKGQVERLEQQLNQDRKALEHWDRTGYVALCKLGLAEAEFLPSFRVLNPSLLHLLVGHSLSVKDGKALLANMRAFQKRIQGNKYQDEAVDLNLEFIPGIDLESIRDKDRMRGRIKLNEQGLTLACEQLKVAQDQAAARQALAAKTAEQKKCQDELDWHERHAEAWKGRAILDSQLKKAEDGLASANRAVTKAREKIEAITDQIRLLREQEDKLKEAIKRIRGSMLILREELGEAGVDIPFLPDEDKERADIPEGTFEEFIGQGDEKCSQILALANRAKKVRPLSVQLGEIETKIMQSSGKFGSQQVYFNDRDEEWRVLLEKRDSLDTLDDVSRRSWDSLFTTLGARLNGIKLGMRSIEQAVTRINAGLKRYRVSNLREVQLRVEKSADVYPMIETMTSMDGIFQNPDLIDEAKKRLRTLIQSAQPIELHALFALHIRVQQNDGQWIEAKSLDEIGSTGTGMTAKAMIFIQLVRAIVGNERYRLHFFMDETGHLDDQNLHATTAMAMSKGILPITAEPDVRIDPVAHPEVTVYALGQNAQGRFHIEGYNTYRAARVNAEGKAAEAGHG